MAINFNSNSAWNLKPINVSEIREEVNGLLVNGEQPICAFKTIRDQLIFTNKRIIAVDVQGLTGSRKSFYALRKDSVLHGADAERCRIGSRFRAASRVLERIYSKV